MPQTTGLLTMPRSNRSTHIRVPTYLRARLSRLRDEVQVAYTEGRVEVPNDLVKHIPVWFVIEDALDEVEARRVRSNRPRPAKTSSGVSTMTSVADDRSE